MQWTLLKKVFPCASSGFAIALDSLTTLTAIQTI